MKLPVLRLSIAALPCLAAIAGCSQDLVPTRPGYELVAAWGDSGSADGQFYFPQGVAVDADGNVYVVDTANYRIQKFTSGGAYLTQWGTPGAGDGQFLYVNDIAVDASGNVYVADAQNGRIQKFTSDGVYLTQWATSRNTSEWNNQGVAVDAAGHVYVVHNRDHYIQVFTADGDSIAQWSTDAFWSQGMAVDSRGTVYLHDGTASIIKYTSTGAYLGRWPMRDMNHGGAERVAVDAAGNVFVTDFYAHSIRKFTGNGRVLAQLSVGDTRWTPDVAVTANGDIYVTDTVHNRILKFAPTLVTRS